MKYSFQEIRKMKIYICNTLLDTIFEFWDRLDFISSMWSHSLDHLLYLHKINYFDTCQAKKNQTT